MATRTRTWTRSRSRTSAWLALWLYAWASAWCGLHAALESHQVCAHGEWTHVEDGCDLAALESSPDARIEVAPIDEHGATEGHGHCGILGRERQVETASVPKAEVGRAQTPRAAPTRLAEAAAASSVPLLALAPHHGPPAG